MISEATRFRIEQRAVAICLAFSGACFAIGLLLQHGSRAWDKAFTWGGTQ